MKFVENDVMASLVRESFYDFVLEFWDTIISDPPVLNWHVRLMCDELQDMAERVFKKIPRKHDIIINVPPGSTKSTICSQMFPAWVWTRMPSARFICVSYAHQIALKDSIKSRDIVTSEKYQRCFPDIRLRLDENMKELFSNTKKGFRLAAGVGGSITGMHANFLIIDDPINPVQAHSDAELRAVNHWMESTISSRKVDKEVTVTILIQQRLHQSDPSGEMLERTKGEKIRHICLPGELTDDVRPLELRDRYVNGLLDPVRMPRTALDQLRQDLGEYGYSSQVLQCLVAGTPITTKRGDVPIESVTINDEVLTRAGFQKVKWSGKTGDADALTGVLFSNGSMLVGTADHPVWTKNRGWISMDALERWDYVLPLSWPKEKQLPNAFCLPVLATIGKRGSRITKTTIPRESISTGMCGNIITETFPRASISITKTGTLITIRSRIWNACPDGSTCCDTQTDRKSVVTFLIEFARSAGIGINQKKARSIIEKMERNGCAVFGVPLDSNRMSAKHADKNSHPDTTKKSSTARLNAKKRHATETTSKNAAIAELTSTQAIPVPIAAPNHVGQNGGGLVVPVYDLTVEGSPEFFAGGILVHNSPIPPGGGQFNVNKLILEDECDVELIRTCRSWDKAGTQDGGAYSVGALCGMDANNEFWILDIVRGRWNSTKREGKIRFTAEQDGVGTPVLLEIEGGSGGKESGENTVRNLAGYRVITFHPTGDKETRAYPLSTQVGAGNVHVLRRPWLRDLIEEMRFFPKSKYKDQIDSLSSAFNHLARKRTRIGGWKNKKRGDNKDE